MKALSKTRYSCLLVLLGALSLPADTPLYTNTLEISRKDLKCLIDNVYYEARGEPFAGQILVAKVTMNRAQSLTNICREVYKPRQFSWTLTQQPPPNKQLYNSLYNVILPAYNSTYDFTHFHAAYVNPKWAYSSKSVLMVGNHVFHTIQ